MTASVATAGTISCPMATDSAPRRPASAASRGRAPMRTNKTSAQIISTICTPW